MWELLKPRLKGSFKISLRRDSKAGISYFLGPGNQGFWRNFNSTNENTGNRLQGLKNTYSRHSSLHLYSLDDEFILMGGDQITTRPP